MFYSTFLYVREGPLAKVWLASHMIRKLDAKEIRNANIDLSIAQMKSQKTPLALRLCGQLLLGLARIYELKVRQTSEEAEQVLKKIQHMIDERVRPATRKRKSAAPGSHAEDDDDESVHFAAADRSKLRASEAAITARLPTRGADARAAANASYSDLGAGLLDMDLDEMLDNPEGLIGEEIDAAFRGLEAEALGEAHLTIDLEKGDISLLGGTIPLSLTQSQHTLQTPHTPMNEPDVLLQEGEDNPFADEESVLAVDEARRVDMSSRYGEEDLDLGGQGGALFDDDAAMPAPMADDTMSKRVEEAEVDARIDEAKAQLERLRREKKDAKAAAKRSRHATYEPVLDDMTELANATLKGWLADTSDIVLRTRPVAHLQRSSYAAQQIEQMRASLHAGLQLPGLRYRSEARAALPDTFNGVPATPANQGGREVFDGLQDNSLQFDDFGGLGGGDGFGGFDDPAPGTEALPQQPEEMEMDIDDRKSVASELHHPAPGAEEEEGGFLTLGGLDLGSEDVAGGAGSAAARQADVRAFFGESARTGKADTADDKENVESGWSRRTKKFHTLLTANFAKLPPRAKDKTLSLQDLLQPAGGSVSSRPRETAAAALYQTLVLASSGFVLPRQEDPLGFGEVTLAKSAKFDNKKMQPKVPHNTGSASSSSGSQSGAHISNTQSSTEY